MKTKIVQAAKAMFLEIGYDKSSVNGLLDRMKIAKGTFYHYFNSKEELLDEVINDFSKGIIAIMEAIAAEPCDALTKLNKMLSMGRQYKVENREMVKMMTAAMYRPENLALRQKLIAFTHRVSVPVIQKIIEQGDKEGVFKSVGPMAGSIILTIGESLSDDTAAYMLKDNRTKEDRDRIDGLSDAYDRSVARLLGVEEGKITFMNREFLDAIFGGMTC